jgi:outer membrane protein TolC
MSEHRPAAMRKLVLDGVEYDAELLSDHGRAQLASLQFLEAQLARLQQDLAIYRTARETYLQALKADIERSGLQPIPGPNSVE